jgi:hypothetical protein
MDGQPAGFPPGPTQIEAATVLVPRRENGDGAVNKIIDLIECMRVGSLLQTYLDGELDDDRGAALVAHHLRACERCGMAADRIAALKDQLAQLRQEPTPEQIGRIEQVIDQLAGHSPGTDRSPPAG